MSRRRRAGAAALGLLAVLLVWLGWGGPAQPGFAQIKARSLSSEAVLLDRHGAILSQLRIDKTRRRLDWVELENIAPGLKQAVIRTEDKRFWRHRGVDWLAIGAAAVKPGQMRGASTLTMQLAGLLHPELKPGGTGRSPWQKIRQMQAALNLERRWSKAQILEAYLNLATYRGELQGIAAAAYGLFGKEPDGITTNEALLLAAMLKSTNLSPRRIAGRAAATARTLGLATDRAQLEQLAQARLEQPYHFKPRQNLAPHLARRLLKGGSRVTTLDKNLQAFVLEALDRHLRDLEHQNVRDGAVLVLDNASGEILAYATNRHSSASYVDGVRAARQAGSTLKPFVYGLAIEKRLLTAASLIEDAPLQISTASGLYAPGNYSDSYAGTVTVRQALAASLNTPAVRALMLLDGDEFLARLKLLGFTGLVHDAAYYGYSMALGSLDVSLYELVGAYRALANGGRYTALTAVKAQASAARQGLSPQASFIVTDILADREARSRTFGLENFLATRYFSAVKTGTSKDMRDNWCLGFSQRYTVGVWVGNFSGAPMWNVSGVSGAAPVWLETMDYLTRASLAPQPPAGLVRQEVCFGDQSCRREWFIQDTAPSGRIEPLRRYGHSRISYPPAATTLALDPDIPAGNQRVIFKASPALAGLRWRLDQRRLGPADKDGALAWQPQPGRHRLELRDSAGQLLDTVTFRVK